MNKLLSKLQNRTIEVRAKANTSLIDTENKTIPFILISKENETTRFDWWEGKEFVEELDVKGANFERLNTLFKDHEPSVDNAIGRVVNTRVEANQLKADVVFGSDDESQKIFNKYAEGILTDVSIGYQINNLAETKKKNEPDHVLVTDYDIIELSAVFLGADKGAKVGRKSPKTKTPISVHERKLKLMKREIS